jgi:hypothetical protein
MDAIRNPFVPGAGSPPPDLVGREGLLQDAIVALTRAKEGRFAKSLILVGLRGVGKTVLLNRMQQQAEELGYEALLLEVSERATLPDLIVQPLRRLLFKLDRAEGLNEQVKRALRTLKAFVSAVKISYGEIEFGLDIEPELGIADSGNLELDLPDLFEMVGKAAQARKTAVAIIIDEIQYLSERELSALIMGIHRTTQKQLPFVLIGAGLPQVIGKMGESKSYAERLFNFPEVGPLQDADAREAINDPAMREGIIFNDDALEEIVETTKGYPYFLQEWGYHAWNEAKISPIDVTVIKAVTPNAIAHLDGSFFRVRFDRLTPKEKTYLRAMAEIGSGPHRSGDIADKLGVAVQSVAPVRASLIKKGMVYSPSHGDTAFTVPLFDQFMKRIIPDFQKDT